MTKDMRKSLRKAVNDEDNYIEEKSLIYHVNELLDALDEADALIRKGKNAIDINIMLANNIKILVHKQIDLESDCDKWKNRCEALERAATGHCYCCEKAQPPKIKTVTGFPNMISCEHIYALAATGETKRECDYWQFDETRFTKGGGQNGD